MKIIVTIELSKEDYIEAVRDGWYDEFSRSTVPVADIMRYDDVDNFKVAFEHLPNEVDIKISVEE
ncbi:hypothetical protein KAR91_20860 [Candidatus Pacearchaeota archaeon]|nr:hypothetical protein [Candidatus Pacearchaeota archaeon]